MGNLHINWETEVSEKGKNADVEGCTDNTRLLCYERGLASVVSAHVCWNVLVAQISIIQLLQLAVSLCISGERKGNKSRGDNSYQQACRYVFTTNPWRLTRRPWNQIIVLSNRLWCMHDRQIVHYGSTWLFCQRNLVSSRLLAAPSTQTVDHSIVASAHIHPSPPGVPRVLLIPISAPAQVSPSNRSPGEVGPNVSCDLICYLIDFWMWLAHCLHTWRCGNRLK